MKLDLAALPKSAQALADLIGLPALLALVQHRGGERFQPPKGGPERLLLASQIGEAAAEKLAATYSEPIDIPKCAAAIRAVTHANLRAEFDALTTGPDAISARAAVRQLVRRYGYTDRWVWALLGRADGDGEVVEMQGVLF